MLDESCAIVIVGKSGLEALETVSHAILDFFYFRPLRQLIFKRYNSQL